jgi:hypothetical protein
MNNPFRESYSKMGETAKFWWLTTIIVLVLWVAVTVYLFLPTLPNYQGPVIELQDLALLVFLVFSSVPLVIIILAWLFYALKKDNRKLFTIVLIVPFALVGFLAILGLISYQQEKVILAEKNARFEAIKELAYTSPKLGISFSYLSTSFEHPELGEIKISEDANSIYLQHANDKDKQSIATVGTKPSGQKLFDYITNKYKASHPNCDFFEPTPYRFENKELEIVEIHDPVINCPIPSGFSWGSGVYISDSAYPNKYVVVFSNTYIGARKNKLVKNPYNLGENHWYGTIKFD